MRGEAYTEIRSDDVTDLEKDTVNRIQPNL